MRLLVEDLATRARLAIRGAEALDRPAELNRRTKGWLVESKTNPYGVDAPVPGTSRRRYAVLMGLAAMAPLTRARELMHSTMGENPLAAVSESVS